MDVLYVGNDHVVEVQGLRDADGKTIPSAAVEVTLYESDGATEVTGVTWPLVLTYEGSRGNYSGELSSSVGVTAGRRYTLKLTATYVSKTYEVFRTVKARLRNE